MPERQVSRNSKVHLHALDRCDPDTAPGHSAALRQAGWAEIVDVGIPKSIPRHKVPDAPIPADCGVQTVQALSRKSLLYF